MNTADHSCHQGMQVCRNGHVITDLLRTFPDRALSHCDRCGAVTLDRCLTCGQELPGSIYVPEGVPIGDRRPPGYCSTCGAAFPWTHRPASPAAPTALAALERILRRLPRAARELRSRHGIRAPLRIEDEYDLEDLVRGLLPLHFDDIRYQHRTPSYTAGNRTDFRLQPSRIALTVKCAYSGIRAADLSNQVREDLRFYQAGHDCRTLVCYVYDPEGRLPGPRHLETAWYQMHDSLEVRAVIAT